MVEEHVGKKRRKEVRTAINMRDDLRNGMLFMICVLLVGIMASLSLTITLGRMDPTADNQWAQMVPTLVIFLFVVFLGTRSYKWSGLKKAYDDHCKRYNITKDDMKALKNGEL